MSSCFRAAALLSLSTFLCPVIVAQYEGATTTPQDVAKGFQAIDEAECEKWLTILASDEFEGRGTGTRGFQKAADFVAARFKEFGLKPVGDKGTYFQAVPFTRTVIDPEKTVLKFKGKGKAITLKADGDITFQTVGTKDMSAALLFVAANNPNARFPDGDILKGRIVIIALPNGAAPRSITSQLRRKRPAAVFYVRDDVGNSRPSVRRGRGKGRLRELRSITGSISREAARRLAKSAGARESIVDPESGTDELNIFRSKKSARLVVNGKTEDIGVPNVVGYLPGSSPKLRDELVICGSHLDHIGIGRDGQINNGADDDGSGSTALLAVARAMTSNGRAPKRSVLFIAVCGEEMGLLGSAYYVENPIFPIAKTVCELQMDMVGRNEAGRQTGQNDKAEDNIQTLHLVGSKKLSKELHELVLSMNEFVNFTFEYDEERVYTRSDHYNFAKKGIPVSFFFSGFHDDYHRPTDTVEKINFSKIANTARLVFLTAFHAADAKKRLRVDKGPLKTRSGL